MTIGSLFSGIGGLELGLERAGLGPVAWQVENNEFCRSVLAHHWPEVTRFSDVRNVGAELPKVDLLCGGFPCQDVSSAGRGDGLEGKRSGLWKEFRRITEELAPPLAVVENVNSGARRWLPHVRRDLHLLGYRTRAFLLSAAEVGAPHFRRRVFVVAADPKRVELREQSRWRGGPNGEGPALATRDGGEGDVANAMSLGRDRWPGVDAASDEGGRAATQGDHAWSVEPGVGRVAHGVPDRVDRLAALGNAVVPQCAEAIGRVIRHECKWATQSNSPVQITETKEK